MAYNLGWPSHSLVRSYTEEVGVEPLRKFLMDNLPENPTQGDAEDTNVITDAIVIYRIQDFSPEGGYCNELYKYTTTAGVSMAMAFGMMEITSMKIGHVYHEMLNQSEEEEDE